MTLAEAIDTIDARIDYNRLCCCGMHFQLPQHNIQQTFRLNVLYWQWTKTFLPLQMIVTFVKIVCLLLSKVEIDIF